MVAGRSALSSVLLPPGQKKRVSSYCLPLCGEPDGAQGFHVLRVSSNIKCYLDIVSCLS